MSKVTRAHRAAGARRKDRPKKRKQLFNPKSPKMSDDSLTSVLEKKLKSDASEVPLIVQYVVIRGDLLKTMGWPVGAVIAQACHASTAVTHMFYNDPHTQKYLADLDNMHKIVLEATDESKLTDLHSKLSEAKIDHKLWIEQPENIPTCLVCKPYPKNEISKFFKKFKLFK